ncbi:MAG: FAD-dependent monooxygenase [Alphaproteobacteria bacterium]|nr:FAD-dependent monooxygenase [Alphaproteobacteria bacterium]
MVLAETDVLIVGAGAVGLTLANDLAARGVDVVIIDALAEPTRNSRAHGLQSRTLECLDVLDLARPILAAAQRPQPPFLIMSGQKELARIDFSAFAHAPFPYQLVVWQQSIERTLAAALQQRARHVARGVQLENFAVDETGVTARLAAPEDERTIRARFIVGCDGGHSAVRHGLGLSMKGQTLPGCFWLGEFDLDWERSRDAIYEWWHEDGMVAAIYIDFNEKWHVFVEFTDGERAEPTLDELQAIFRDRTGERAARLSNPLWRGKLVVNQRMPDHFIVGRAILAGDAAHVHSAAGGQGMNTGIQDALNLGWKLALAVAGAAAPALLSTYESERLPNARNVLRKAQSYHRLEVPHGAVGRWAGALVVKAIQSIRPFGAAALARIGMLDIGYEDSVLSHQETPARGPLAGQRVPDAPCRLDGKASRMHDVIRGSRAHLFMFAGRKPTRDTLEAFRAIEAGTRSIEAQLRVLTVFASETQMDGTIPSSQTITDGGGYLQRALGWDGPELMYVRPDGYIGLRLALPADKATDKALFAYLRRVYAGL